MKHLLKLLTEKKMLVIAGTGGVGKTTLSCALGLKAARLGRKTLVLTIDPSRRLKSTLGLDEGSPTQALDQPQKVKISPETPLWAMILNTQKTFDAVIRKYAPSQDIVDKILSNKIYKALSNSMAGTQEYMALEKLYELHETGEFDLMILDTPPTQHAMTFLEAPDRLANFLDENTLNWFLKPYFKLGKFSLKLFASGSKIFMQILEKITGLKILQDLSEFLMSLQTLYAGFKTRTLKAKDILSHPKTSFCVVTCPSRLLLEQTLSFEKQLSKKNIQLDTILINRTTQAIPLSEEEAQDLKTFPRQNLSNIDQIILDIFEKYEALWKTEKKEIKIFKTETCAPQVLEIPLFEEDIYDIKGLNRLNLHIFS